MNKNNIALNKIYIREYLYKHKNTIFVYLLIITIICFGIMDYYSKIPKKSDVERYFLNKDVHNICIIFEKTMEDADRYKDVRASAIEALIRIGNVQAEMFLDKYILGRGISEDIRKEILDQYTNLNPMYIDNKIENYKIKIRNIDKNNSNFWEYQKNFDQLMLFANSENSMQKIVNILYFESIDAFLNAKMTDEAIKYFDQFSKYKDESKFMKVIDSYINQYVYVKKLNDKKLSMLEQLDNKSKERNAILNQKYSTISGYITSQYDATSYWFRDAYGFTGILKTTVTIFTSPGTFTIDVVHLGNTDNGFPLFLEDTSRKQNAIKMMKLLQEEESLREKINNMEPEVTVAEGNLEDLRKLLLDFKKEENISNEIQKVNDSV